MAWKKYPFSFFPGPGKSLKIEYGIESFGILCKKSSKVLEFQYFLIKNVSWKLVRLDLRTPRLCVCCRTVWVCLLGRSISTLWEIRWRDLSATTTSYAMVTTSDLISNVDELVTVRSVTTDLVPVFFWLFSYVIKKCHFPSVLWRCWLGGRKGMQPVKTAWWGAGVVICLEQGADLIPLPLTLSCFSEIQIGSALLVPARSPG